MLIELVVGLNVLNVPQTKLQRPQQRRSSSHQRAYLLMLRVSDRGDPTPCQDRLTGHIKIGQLLRSETLPTGNYRGLQRISHVLNWFFRTAPCGDGVNLPHHIHRGQEGKYRTMKNSLNRIRTNVYGGSSEIGQGGARIVRFPNPEFQFPNSEFRMGYGGFGIPHHVLADRGMMGRV